MMKWMQGKVKKEPEPEPEVPGKFQKTAKLMTKVMKWYKPQHPRSSNITHIEESLDKPLDNYNAWQQLKIFQRAISTEPNCHEEERGRLERQECVEETDTDSIVFRQEPSQDRVLIKFSPPPYKPPPAYRPKKLSQVIN